MASKISAYEILASVCDKQIDVYGQYIISLRARISEIEIEKMENGRSGIDNSKNNELKQIYDYNGYVIIAILDLAVSQKYLISSKSDWERMFFIKHSYLTIYEVMVRIETSKQINFLRQTIISHCPSLMDGFNNILNEIEKFKSDVDYKRRIYSIRNNIAGHITTFKSYYDIAYSLDGEDCGLLIKRFLQTLISIDTFLKQLHKSIKER